MSTFLTAIMMIYLSLHCVESAKGIPNNAKHAHPSITYNINNYLQMYTETDSDYKTPVRNNCIKQWADNTRFDCEKCSDQWEDTMDRLKHGDTQDYLDIVSPYWNASWIIYWWGDRHEHPEEVYPRWPTGWDLIHERYPGEHGGYGMHALAFASDADNSSVMISVRGTEDDPLIKEGLSDICAGLYMCEYGEMLPECDIFTHQELDYFTQLEQFVGEVRSMYPADNPPCLIFTGHSMGSYLSSLMSMSFMAAMPAITFGGPGVIYSAKKYGIPIVSENSFNIYTEFDPIVVMPLYNTNQTGWGCKYEKPCTPKVCEQCIEDNYIDLANRTNNACGLCYNEEHTNAEDMRNYLFKLKVKPECFRFDSNTATYISISYFMLSIVTLLTSAMVIGL